MRLGRQQSSARWTIALLLVVVLAPVLLCVLGTVAVQPATAADVAQGLITFARNMGALGVVLLAALVILPIAGLVYGIARLTKGRGIPVHLKGTVLIVDKSSVDLATALQVWIDESPVHGGVIVPHLNARRSDGPVVRLPLGSHKGGLPAGDLAALAHAIDAGVRGTAASALQATDTANRLREWSLGRRP
ncbi:hypothetical protein [Phytomonospora endophytica]|uniref:Uncharacterized protein n=1 Tax=Phytomonospora endophytica TaxID=714109 RepID=A0A841FSJ0_9ACTN|nr:hypothetical protein [Phytomonospora endophytica]MBB6036277.1 hypothetical protein [Phytomonospora endophytica]GIG67184.1 hypothetical protein Pen01_34790 [Phytomonospora endophytica]